MITIVCKQHQQRSSIIQPGGSISYTAKQFRDQSFTGVRWPLTRSYARPALCALPHAWWTRYRLLISRRNIPPPITLFPHRAAASLSSHRHRARTLAPRSLPWLAMGQEVIQSQAWVQEPRVEKTASEGEQSRMEGGGDSAVAYGAQGKTASEGDQSRVRATATATATWRWRSGPRI
jgi:hypothetical protein